MRRHWIKTVPAAAALLALAACTHPGPKTPVDIIRSAGDVVGLGLVVSTKAGAGTVGGITAAFGDVFGAYGTKGREDELREALRAMDEGRSDRPDVPALRGLSGFSAAEFAQQVLNPDQERRVTGLIGDYYFEEQTGRGHITFDLVTEITDGDKKKIIRRHWHIEVLGRPDGEEGFRTVQRVEVPGPDGLYFPGTIRLPDMARSRTDPNGIWVRGLDHKLYAEGSSIKVTDVYQQIDDGPISRLPDSDPFYKQTAWSCIDLLTKGSPPALRIDPVFESQSAYCLGGCGMGSSGTRYLINSM